MLDLSVATVTAARDRHGAVAAFSTYSIEITRAIVSAAERLGRPAIIQAGSSAFRYAGRAALAAATVATARAAAVPIGVHLDHCREVDEIDYCIRAGYSSVMIDGSHLPFAENVALTRSVVARAHDAGLWVEGELGSIAGDEDTSGRAGLRPPLTEAGPAGEFAELTGVDCLAVAVGNVHGLSSEPIELDLDRLAEIRAACPVPLVLHGASGLPDEMLRAAVTTGVAKVNVNTELRKAFMENIDPVAGTAAGYSFAALTEQAVCAVEEVAAAKMRLLADTAP
jgi:tagatose 1,6-diphosphate aldolase GatY/KbaY